ncbi:MAG: hypothetical protein K2L38_04970 [Dysosmobacter sp.]|nr:hypothetical protein [Dysosmobacter sp.]
MKREEDDSTAWRSRKENQIDLFPYVYPDMPPRFRRCHRFAQALFLLEWGSLFALTAGLLLQGGADSWPGNAGGGLASGPLRTDVWEYSCP